MSLCRNIFICYIIIISYNGYLQSNVLAADENKSSLRYGFQNTKQCKDFKKAYICIRKCLDFGFDVGIADRKCECKCFKNRDKGQYTTPRKFNATKYKLGAPKTSPAPYWLLPDIPQPTESLTDSEDDTVENDNANSMEDHSKGEGINDDHHDEETGEAEEDHEGTADEGGEEGEGAEGTGEEEGAEEGDAEEGGEEGDAEEGGDEEVGEGGGEEEGGEEAGEEGGGEE